MEMSYSQSSSNSSTANITTGCWGDQSASSPSRFGYNKYITDNFHEPCYNHPLDNFGITQGGYGMSFICMAATEDYIGCACDGRIIRGTEIMTDTAEKIKHSANGKILVSQCGMMNYVLDGVTHSVMDEVMHIINAMPEETDLVNISSKISGYTAKITERFPNETIDILIGMRSEDKNHINIIHAVDGIGKVTTPPTPVIVSAGIHTDIIKEFNIQPWSDADTLSSTLEFLVQTAINLEEKSSIAIKRIGGKIQSIVI